MRNKTEGDFFILSFSFLSFFLYWELNPTPHPALSSIAILDYDTG